MRSCEMCDNATTNSELNRENDLSYSVCGIVYEMIDVRMLFRTGDDKPTRLLIEKHGRYGWQTIAQLTPLYCPFCGRPLYENIEFFMRQKNLFDASGIKIENRALGFWKKRLNEVYGINGKYDTYLRNYIDTDAVKAPENMHINIDIFKPTGKWYCNKEVKREIDIPLYDDRFKKFIFNQLPVNCPGGYVVISDYEDGIGFHKAVYSYDELRMVGTHE